MTKRFLSRLESSSYTSTFPTNPRQNLTSTATKKLGVESQQMATVYQIDANRPINVSRGIHSQNPSPSNASSLKPLQRPSHLLSANPSPGCKPMDKPARVQYDRTFRLLSGRNGLNTKNIVKRTHLWITCHNAQPTSRHLGNSHQARCIATRYAPLGFSTIAFL